MDCLFCKIARKEIPVQLVYEDENAVAFYDIHPKAPLHLLIVSKKHIDSVSHLEQEDKALVGELLFIAKVIAQKYQLSGYKLQINVGRDGGQEIDHLHIHLLSNTKID